MSKGFTKMLTRRLLVDVGLFTYHNDGLPVPAEAVLDYSAVRAPVASSGEVRLALHGALDADLLTLQPGTRLLALTHRGRAWLRQDNLDVLL